jgi:hypothetical protein
MLLALLAGAAGTAEGQTGPGQPRARRVPHTVTELAAVCGLPPEAPEHVAASHFCAGFLAGAGQFHAALYPLDAARRPIFCLPDPPPPLREVAAAFVAWARNNPQHAGESAVDGLMRFANQAYPCPSEARPPAGRRRS